VGLAAGLQPSRAEVAAYHRLRLAEKAAVAIGFVAEREADQVVSDPHRDEAPGGEPVRGQAVPGGEHVIEQVCEIVVALPLLPLELAAARRRRPGGTPVCGGKPPRTCRSPAR